MTCLALLALLVPASAMAQSTAPAASTPPVTLVLFHGEGCPHCAAEREFLTQLSKDHPALVIEQHEVWYDAANRALLAETAQRLGFEPTGVPVTVIGDRVWIGFSDVVASEITGVVTAALEGHAPDRQEASADPPQDATRPATVDVPVIGAVDVSSSSLLAATLAIGFVDGVNPCSLWVLSLLLAMVISRGSRGRVVLVGSTFLAVTAAMYALHIVGFYSALDYIGAVSWIRLVVAGIALVFGVLQLKDGIWPGTGPSLSIAPSARPRIYQQLRSVAAPDRRLAATVAGTVALAVGVSLLETPCTAGLPLLWTSLLAERGVTTVTAVALFAVYMAVFLLDELIVFGFAVVTLRGARLQENHGRALKILAGSFLVTLGVAMLAAPDALDSLTGAAVVFGSAVAVAVLVWLVTLIPGRAVRHT